MNTLSVLALILIFLGGIGAILLTIGQSISSSNDKNDIINNTKTENSTLKQEIKELRGERAELTKALEKRDRILQEKNNEIIDLNKKITEKSQYIQDYLTGGNGYAFLNFGPFAGNAIRGAFKISARSKFPIYNLAVTVFDYDLLEKSYKSIAGSAKPSVKQQDFFSARIIDVKLDELSPHQSWIFDKNIDLREARYFVQLRARNSIIVEKIVTLIHNHILYFGFQVFTNDGKIIEESFGEGVDEEIKQKLRNKLLTITSSLEFDLAE